MPEESRHEHEQDHARKARHEATRTSGDLNGRAVPVPPTLYSTGLVGDPRLNGRGNQPVKNAVMQRVQRTYGNRAAQRAIAIQRTPPNAPPASTTAAPSSTTATTGDTARAVQWEMPMELGTATTHAEAAIGLIQIGERLTQLRDALEPDEAASLAPDQRAVTMLLNDIPRDTNPLTAQDMIPVNLAMSMVMRHYNELTQTLRDRTLRAFRSLMAVTEGTNGRTEVQQEALAEELHNAFISNNTSRISQVRSAISTLNDYKEKADRVVTWAQRASSAVGSARGTAFLEAVSSRSEQLGTGIGHIQNFLTAAQAVTTLSGIDGQAISPMHNSIGQMRAALGGIDLAMNLAKGVPLIGTLWSDYYRPMTEACLNILSRIATIQDRQTRWFARLDFSTRSGNGVPTIRPEHLSAFPGGQPILNYMYEVVNNGEPQMNQTIERFFIQHRNLFNAAEPHDQLQTESDFHWYNPFSWGSEDRSPRLGEWIQRNRNTIWSALYGDMPHNMR